MKQKILFFLVITILFTGCIPQAGEKEDACARTYYECMDDCKIMTALDTESEKEMCDMRCETQYGGCSWFGKTANTLKDVGRALKRRFITKEDY